MVGEEFQVLFSGLSPEVQLFQHIVSESADDIYVIDSENYDLLYANSLKSRGGAQSAFPAGKCYEVLHGRTEPCEFCSLYFRRVCTIGRCGSPRTERKDLYDEDPGNRLEWDPGVHQICARYD